MATFYSVHGKRIVLRLRVQPGASRLGFAGVVGDRLKLKVNAKAVEDKANEAAVAFLADFLGVPKSHITIVGGAHARDKTVLIDADLATVQQRLDQMS